MLGRPGLAGALPDTGQFPDHVRVAQCVADRIAVVGLPAVVHRRAGERGSTPAASIGTRPRRSDTVSKVSGGLALVPPKSRAGRRTIPMPEQLVGALRVHRAVQATERLAAGSLWTDSGMVFTGPIGKPIDPRADHVAAATAEGRRTDGSSA